MLLIETTHPLFDDSRVPHPLETVSIEYIHSPEGREGYFFEAS